jgi:hypothetical protein
VAVADPADIGAVAAVGASSVSDAVAAAADVVAAVNVFTDVIDMDPAMADVVALFNTAAWPRAPAGRSAVDLAAGANGFAAASNGFTALPLAFIGVVSSVFSTFAQ